MIGLFQRLTYSFLWLTIFTMPFQKSFIIPGVGSINKAFGILLVLTAIYTVLIQKEFKKPPAFFYLLGIFILLNLLSYFWAKVPLDALDKSLLLLQLGFVSWSIYEFSTTKQKVKNLFKAYILGCVVIGSLSLYKYLTGSYVVVSSTRFFIEGYNPNELGVIWALSLPMAMYLIVEGSKKFIVYIPFIMYLILLTGSRTALIVLVFICLSILWMLFKYRVRFRKTILFSLVGLGTYALSKMPAGQLERLSTIQTELSGGTLNGRTGIWESGLVTFGEHPILGVGAGSFLEASVLNSASGIEYSAHSSYLSVLVENGLVGFLLFAVMMLTLFVSSIFLSKKNPARWVCLTLIACWLIISLASHAEAQKYTWIIFGMIATISSSRNINAVKTVA